MTRIPLETKRYTFQVMHYVDEHPGALASAISESLGLCTRSKTVYSMLSQMVDEGLAVREDLIAIRPRAVFTLTDKGRRFMEALP